MTGLPETARGMANTRYDDKDVARPVAFPVIEPEKDVDLSRYLLRQSDAVALLVLGHQVEAHNRMTRASYAVQFALRDERAMKEALGDKSTGHSESIERRIRSGCEPLVQYLLFSGEARLPVAVGEGSAFAKEFSEKGPRDGKGRSLRDLDLKTRLLK